MLASNHLYGHDRILARYCGLTAPRPICGELQHGWNWDCGFPITSDHRRPIRPRVFVWSRFNQEAARRKTALPAVPIGAPLLYHDAPLEDPVPGSLLACPAHGWERGPLVGDMRGYLRSLDLIRHRFSRVTVCLYWLEYQDAEIRALYEDAGYPIVTNGHRDANPAFLDNLCRNLSRHEYVTTNVVGTVAFYALYLSRKMFLWGTPMYASDAGEAARAGLVAIQEGRCSILHYDRFGDRCHRAVGEAELGSEFRRSPQDLKVVLGWDRDPRVIHAERATRRVLDRVWMWGREARTVAMSTGASVVGADRRRVRWARRQGR